MGKGYSAKLKFQVVTELLAGGKTTAQVAKVYGIHPNTVNAWRKTFLEKGPDIFAEDSIVDQHCRTRLEPVYVIEIDGAPILEMFLLSPEEWNRAAEGGSGPLPSRDQQTQAIIGGMQNPDWADGLRIRASARSHSPL